MSLTDNDIFDPDENVTRTPVSYRNRYGITIAAFHTENLGRAARTRDELTAGVA